MKSSTYLLLPVLLASLNIAATAQEFAPVGAKWHYTYSDEYWPVNYPVYNFNVTTVEAIHDTVIGNITARVLQVTNNDSCNALRNQLLVYEKQNQVFIKDEMRPEFYLLYDFNAQKGDSWSLPGYPELGDSIKITVDSVAFGVYGSDTLSEMFVNFYTEGTYDTPENLYSTINLNENKIVARMGHLFNLFPWWGGLCHKSRAVKLRCYSDSNFSWHSNPEFENNCDTVYSHNTLIKEQPQPTFSLHPNPATEKIFATFFDGPKQRTLSVIDYSGKPVLTIETTEAIAEIQLSAVPAGIYILLLTDEDKISRARFIKIP